ncbi:MAG: DMT family transporter [Spirochaetaceae bacterium]|jgi:drug/metabolite transporter (DMT)-like permease|nr:DMT family transporter [Spirochaetaceae bacterium]
MDAKAIKADMLLVLTACIWGLAFTAQRAGMDYIGPFTYNGLRFLLGGIIIMPLAFFRGKKQAEPAEKTGSGNPVYPVTLGICLFVAAGFQQTGIFWTTAGNSGFLSGIYVVLVPVFGIFLGRRAGSQTFAAATLTLAGLFFVIGGVNLKTVNKGDALTLIGGVFWSAHVLLIDRFVQKTDAVKLACGQFIVCGILSLAAALSDFSGRAGFGMGAELGARDFRFSLLAGAALPVLYGGAMSVGVGYTLQVVAQRDAPPAHAAVILCMESVFAALGGMLLLSEKQSRGILLGFALMLAGMLATQWDMTAKRRVPGLPAD